MSDKAKHRRASKARSTYIAARTLAAKFGLDLEQHNDFQYALAWPTGNARWELYPSTQRIIINSDRKDTTPLICFRPKTWTLVSVVKRAAELLSLKEIGSGGLPTVEIMGETFHPVDEEKLGFISVTREEKTCPLARSGAWSAPDVMKVTDEMIACRPLCKWRKLCDVFETIEVERLEAFATNTIVSIAQQWIHEMQCAGR